jgi:hypothetical protein
MKTYKILCEATLLLAIFTIYSLNPSLLNVVGLQGDAVDVYLYMFVLETNSDWIAPHFSSGPSIVCLNYALAEGARFK